MNGCICISLVSPGFFSMMVYVIQNIRYNKNFSIFLNVVVNYHYHDENRIVTR